METAIQILLLIVLTPIAFIILVAFLDIIADSYWQGRNRKYQMEQRSKKQ